MRKRVLTFLLAAGLACGVAPATAWADATIQGDQAPAPIEEMVLPGSDTDANGMAYLEEMEKQSLTEPADLAKAPTPYGTGKDEAFTIVEKPQLYSLDSENLDQKDASLRQTIAKGQGLAGETASLIPKGKILSYMQGASFDPTGCGRRTHLGVVGYDSKADEVKVYVLNAESGNPDFEGQQMVYEATIASGDKTAWLKAKNSSDKKSGIDTADAMNFFQATAGDYDHNGSESLVVYGGCLTGSNDALFEVTLDGSNWNCSGIEAKDLLNPSYLKAGMSSSKSLGDRLGVSLATGDVDDDGTDDLVVVSSAAKRSGAYKKSADASEACKPYAAIARGEKGKEFGQLHTSGQVIEQAVGGTTRTMAAPGVSAGDIDGDGRDEVVTAGFMNYWTSGNPTNLQTGSTKKTDKVAFAYFDCDTTKDEEGNVTGVTLTRNGDVRELSGAENVSRISQGRSVRTDNATSSNAWQQFSVECVAFDGIDAKEYVFLNGFVFSLEGALDSNYLAPVMNDQFFNTTISGNFLRYGSGVHDFQYGITDENFVYSAAVGNFSGNDNGAETLVLSMGYKRNEQTNYSFGRVVVRKDEQGKFVVQAPELREHEGKYFLNRMDERSDAYGKGLNHLVVAVDKDYDSVVGKYSGTSFAYTDPSVAAVLQASPYFRELGIGISSGTRYSHSESLTRGTGESKEVSYTIGRTNGTTFGPLSIESAKTYATGFTEGYASSVTTEYSSDYTCFDMNQVLVRRTLVYYYFYDVLNAEGTFDQSALVVAVPQKPTIAQLSMEQYNELARAYNEKYGSDEHRMDEITPDLADKYFLNNEANPYAYPQRINEVVFNGTGIDMGNGRTQELGHAGGNSSQSYTVTKASEKTSTASDGMETQMSYKLGTGTTIPFIGDVSVSRAYSSSVGVVTGRTATTSKMSSTGAGGTVENLGGDKALASYKFNWKLAGWKGGDDLFKDVLFVGYVVTGQDAPVAPVTDLRATYAAGEGESAGAVTLTWTSPRRGEGRRDISGFDVYRKDGGSYHKLNVVPIASAGELKTQQLTVEADRAWGFEATFVVRALGEQGGYDSIDSNEARCFLATRVGLGGDPVAEEPGPTTTEPSEPATEAADPTITQPAEEPVEQPAEPTEEPTEPSVTTPAEPEAETMQRLYNPWSGEHLFTTDASEVSNLLPLGWQDEGSAWKAPKESDTPVYRLYNPYSGDHHYTADEAEYDQLSSIGWSKEGVAFYSADEEGQPVYRLFNPWATQGTHHFTADEAEYDHLASLGWSKEGIAFYGM